MLLSNRQHHSVQYTTLLSIRLFSSFVFKPTLNIYQKQSEYDTQLILRQAGSDIITRGSRGMSSQKYRTWHLWCYVAILNKTVSTGDYIWGGSAQHRSERLQYQKESRVWSGHDACMNRMHRLTKEGTVCEDTIVEENRDAPLRAKHLLTLSRRTFHLVTWTGCVKYDLSTPRLPIQTQKTSTVKQREFCIKRMLR